MDFCSLIIGFVFGIAGSFIGAWFSHFFSERRRRNEAFEKAALEFQCAFVEALQRLRDDPRADWHNVLNSAVLIEHEKAAIKFRLFLSGENRINFDREWNTYFSHRPHPGDRHAPEKKPEEWSNGKNCKIFIEQIERLLSYAQLK